MLINSIKEGAKKGLETTWMLAKVMVPVYFALAFLQETPIIGWIDRLFQPLMTLFNLPGEAAIVLILGNVLTLYAAVGAIKAISLTISEITIIAVMLSFSHAIFVETAITKKMGVSAYKVIIIRVGLAIVSGLVLGRVGVLL